MTWRGFFWLLGLHARLVATCVIVSLFATVGVIHLFFGSWGIDLLWWVRRW
jgi:hypothetical protein